ncbi:MAG TPA: cupin domain-containing protein [Opitutaceae bacterium]
MNTVNLDDLPWEEWSSPGGRFHGLSKELSIALGAQRNATLGDGGHPFDLELGRLRPGKSGCPMHSHSSQWELFVFLSGAGTVRYGSAQGEVRAGDAVMHPPGEAHQLINTGATDLDYLLVADNPLVDIWHYPDSDKWGFRKPRKFFRATDLEYYVGEDDGPPLAGSGEDGLANAASPPEPPGPLARFVSLESIPWELRQSPKKKYASYCRDISLALGGTRDVGPWAGGHPFDLQIRRVPPGAAVCPLHAHSMQWEMFWVISGTATVRTRTGAAAAEARQSVRAGDVFLQSPGTAHQILNTGDEEFVFYVVADNPPAETCYYPESDKWMIKPQRKVVRITETDYFDGEE